MRKLYKLLIIFYNSILLREAIDIKKIKIVIMSLLFILTSTIPVISSIPSANSSNRSILYVGGTGEGNYSTIQDAINNASHGDTILVSNGIYYENVIINRSIILRGEDKNQTVIYAENASRNAIRITSDFVFIENFTVKGAYGNISGYSNGVYSGSAGILAEYHDYLFINNTIITNNTDGIFFHHTNNNIDPNLQAVSIQNNCINNNSHFCIHYITGNNITIEHNELYNSGFGINAAFAYNCKIIDNRIQNISNSAIHLQNINNSFIEHNYIKNNSDGLHIFDDSSSLIISDNQISNSGNGLTLSESYYNQVYNNSLMENQYSGLYLFFSENNVIFNNSISNNIAGIGLLSSLNNTISDNNLHNNTEIGISIESNIGWNNTILNNSIILSHVAVYLYGQNNTTIKDNIISECMYGIDIDFSENISINNNTISDSQWQGISLDSSINNFIMDNSVINSFGNNIYLLNSNNNSIFHNTFIGSNPQAIDYNTNSWDNGYPSGGNYWDDYPGTDQDNDGIGDYPYNITGGSNQDHYPLGYFHPIANFTYYPNNPIMQSLVYFTDTSIDPDGTIVSWFWEFGDGDTSTQQNPYNLFVNEGIFTVCLTVIDDDGKNNTYCQIINVTTGLDVNQSNHDRGFPIRHTWDGDWGAAQNFTPNCNTLTYIQIYIRKFGTPEFNLTIELRKDHPEGTLLDTLLFTPEELASSWQWLDLDFEDITIEPDTNLFIVLPPAPSGISTSFGYEWGYAFGDQYQPGSFWFTRDGGNLWRDLPSRYEFVFKTYGYN
jgi:parallel beta-helix repeat protein